MHFLSRASKRKEQRRASDCARKQNFGDPRAAENIQQNGIGCSMVSEAVISLADSSNEVR